MGVDEHTPRELKVGGPKQNRRAPPINNGGGSLFVQRNKAVAGQVGRGLTWALSIGCE